VKKEIAFFDFDGTITTSDTFLDFIKFSKGTLRFYLGFLLHSPWLAAFKLKLISNQSAKEKILKYYFGGMPAADFERLCREFTEKVVPKLIRPKALEEIKKFQQAGTAVVIVSASPENWIKHWADLLKVELIASKLEIKEGRITGKIIGKNCRGPEKVRRILEKYQVKDYEVIHAYGDTSGDLDMLKMATNSYFRPFRS
jgi:HAD superfamily hydrolase (TIGR01490 family)